MGEVYDGRGAYIKTLHGTAKLAPEDIRRAMEGGSKVSCPCQLACMTDVQRSTCRLAYSREVDG